MPLQPEKPANGFVYRPPFTQAVYQPPFTKGTADAADIANAGGRAATAWFEGTADAGTITMPTEIFEGVFGTVGPPTQPSTRLLNLLQEAFDAGEDPDLTFDDFIRYALQGKMLTIEVL